MTAPTTILRPVVKSHTRLLAIHIHCPAPPLPCPGPCILTHLCTAPLLTATDLPPVRASAQVPDEKELMARKARVLAAEAQANGEATAAEAAGAPAVAIPVTTAAGLPFQPITLVFKDIHYYVPNPAAKQKVEKGEGLSRVPGAPVVPCSLRVCGLHAGSVTRALMQWLRAHALHWPHSPFDGTLPATAPCSAGSVPLQPRSVSRQQ